MQQRTSSLPQHHPVRALEGLARQIALPHEYEPERYPSFPALERTAKMGFNQPTNLDVPANTTRKLALFRQAAFPVWGDRVLDQSTYYGYTYETAAAQGNNSGAIQETYTVIYDANIYGWQNTARTAGPLNVGVSGVASVADVLPYPVMGLDSSLGGRPFIYLPENSILTLVVRQGSAVPAGFTTIVTMEKWESPGESSSLAILPITTNTGNFGGGISVIGNSGWVRPSMAHMQCTGVLQPFHYLDVIVTFGGSATYTPSISNGGNIAVTSGSGAYFVPLVTPSEFRNSQLPWYSARVTASAVLATNVTTVLNKGGTVLAGRVSPQVLSPWRVTKDYINTLHPAEKAFLPMETGLYSYCPPSTDMANFWDYTLPTGVVSTSPSISPAPVVRLDNDAMVNYAFFTSPASIESLALNIDWHIEFRTSSALFDVGMSTVTLETLHQAQIALASVGFFFENFNHKKVLDAVIKAVRTYGPKLASYVSPIAGEAVDLIMSRVPQGTMKTTSIATAPPDNSHKAPQPKKKPKAPPQKQQQKKPKENAQKK